MLKNIKLIIGLGNPDKRYADTYHNVGHLAVEYLSKILASRFSFLVSDVYMNESGRFVAQALKKRNIKPEELLVIHDDSDLTIGNFKLSFGRGAAGHHGVESVQAALKTKNFWRLRIGIRPPKEKIRQKAEALVLKKISSADKKILDEVFKQITNYL